MCLQESRSPARAPPPGLAQATLLDNAQSDASERASLATVGTCNSLSQPLPKCSLMANQVADPLLPVNRFCIADGVSETSHDPNRYPSSSQNLNWDDSTTFRHVNGITVYEQQEPDSKQSTYMVSASVHASPEDCLKVWTDNSATSCSLLHRLPAHTCRVCTQIMQAHDPLAPQRTAEGKLHLLAVPVHWLQCNAWMSSSRTSCFCTSDWHTL